MVRLTTDMIAINKDRVQEIVGNIKTSMGEIDVMVNLHEDMLNVYVFTFKKPVGNGNPSTIDSDIRNRWKTIAYKYAFSANLNCT